MRCMHSIGVDAVDESDEDEVDDLEEEHDELELWYLNIMIEPDFINF